MNAVETVKVKVRRIVSNKGHVRLFVLVSVIWMAASAAILWQQPLPSFGDGPGVIFPDDYIVLQRAINLELARRAAVILFVPLILPLILIVGALVFQWIKDGYSKNPPANPN